MNNREYKIYRFFDGADYDQEEAPTDFNYTSPGLDQRLYALPIFTKGRISRVEFYGDVGHDASGELVGSDLVVSEDHVYSLDAAGLARFRTITITWYREDGTPGQTKQRPKKYNNAQARQEGRRRRRNVIDKLSIDVVGMVAMTETSGHLPNAIALATPWLEAREELVAQFLELSGSALRDSALADTHTSWLNNLLGPGFTIRDHIAQELS